jgi:Tfp pilus assembly protein PilE
MKNNRGNSLAEFAVTMALMATLATTAAPAFSRIGESAKAKQTKRNLETIAGAARTWYNRQVEVVGMGTFPSQAHREDDVGDIIDTNDNRRIEKSDIELSTFIPVWADTVFLHQFDNDTISSPYQNGKYHFGVLGGSGTGDNIVSPIFVVVDTENAIDFNFYFKP